MNKKMYGTIFLALFHSVLWFLVIIPFLYSTYTLFFKILLLVVSVLLCIITSKIPHYHPKGKIMRMIIVFTVLVLVILYYYNFNTILNIIK